MLDIIIAAIAGFVSFISPCVLPLVPAYIGYMGGRMTHTVSAQVAVAGGGTVQIQERSLAMRFSTVMHGLAFVGGFTFIFVLLGLMGTAFIQQVGSTNVIEAMIGRIGGIFIIFFGLHYMGVLPAIFARLRRYPAILSSLLTSIVFAVIGYALIAWGFTGTVDLTDTAAYPGWAGALTLLTLAAFAMGMVLGGAFARPSEFWNKVLNTIEYALYADTRMEMDAYGSKGLSGSALMGVVFAAGWTPCIGPTLGLAWTMAANGGDLGHATLLMIAYSLGLGIPFLLTALMLDSAQGVLRRLKSHMRTIKLVSGAFLVYIGFMIASGNLQSLSQEFSVKFGDFSYRVEQCTVGAFEGEIGWNQYGTCMSGDEDFEALRSAENPVEQSSIDPLSVGTISDLALAVEDTVSTSTTEDIPVGLAVGNRAPDFQTTTVAGEVVSLSDLRGQVVLLNFWFTSCAPCRVEMPDLQATYTTYRDDDFTVLAVNREEDAETITAFAESLNGLSFPLALDESGDIQYLYDVVGYPKSYLVDRDGIIVHVAHSILTQEQLEELLMDTL